MYPRIELTRTDNGFILENVNTGAVEVHLGWTQITTRLHEIMDEPQAENATKKTTLLRQGYAGRESEKNDPATPRLRRAGK